MIEKKEAAGGAAFTGKLVICAHLFNRRTHRASKGVCWVHSVALMDVVVAKLNSPVAAVAFGEVPLVARAAFPVTAQHTTVVVATGWGCVPWSACSSITCNVHHPASS
jgi:hypothetical protein